LCAGFYSPPSWSAPAETTSATRSLIEITETNKDAGAVEQGTPVRYRFELRNRGQADLEIRHVKPSCGCSVAKWDRVVKPGATSVIEAEMNTEHFRGQVSKHLTVITNDPEHPEVELTISARVDPVVWIKPGSAAEVSVEDRPVTRTFLLERNGGRPMKILQVTPGSPFVTAAATPLSGDGRFEVRVTSTPQAPFGRSTVPVTVRTDQENASRITLLMTVDKGIVAEPPIVFYGLVPNEIKNPVQAAITLSRRSSPFRVTSVSVDDSKLSARLETVREGSEYRIVVTYAGGWNTGLMKSMLKVATDDKAQPLLEVPVQAVVQTKVVTVPPGAAR